MTEQEYIKRQKQRRKKWEQRRRRERNQRRMIALGMLLLFLGIVFLAVKAAGKASGTKTQEVSASTAVSGPRQTAEAQHVMGELPQLGAVYGVRPAGRDWSASYKDNICALAPQGGYLTAIRITLENQPEKIDGTLEYSVNLSGSGWLNWTSDDSGLGDLSGDIALEAIGVRLSGQLADYYDVLYCVLQNDAWTEWVRNGEEAGVSGAGLHVDGIRITIVRKNAGTRNGAGGIDPTKPMVALTFDDGPSKSETPRILDKLEQYQAHATFFMVGQQAEKNPEVVLRMVELGCEPANHTYDHTSMNKLTPEELMEQLEHTNRVVEQICGVTPTLMRPVGGNENDAGLQAVGALGMPAIRWSVDTLDWKTRDAASTIQKVRDQVQDGDIILMHDLYSATADACMTIIEDLIKQGYQLVTVSELSAYRGGLKPGKTYQKFKP